MKENWAYIDGCKKMYQISSFGRIKSFHSNKEKLIKIQFNIKNRYAQVCLYLDKKVYQHKVHRLVAEAFVPNPLNKPHVNHIDNNPTNNRASNLEWVTPKENTAHMLRNNRQARGEKHGNSKLSATEIREIRDSNLHPKTLAEAYSVGRPTIINIKNRKSWKHI